MLANSKKTSKTQVYKTSVRTEAFGPSGWRCGIVTSPMIGRSRVRARLGNGAKAPYEVSCKKELSRVMALRLISFACEYINKLFYIEMWA